MEKIGSFVVMDIGFETKTDREKFEKKYKIRKYQILVDEYSNSFGFMAWTYLRHPILNPVYYMGFMGYGDPKEILKECLKKEIKITFLAWIPINDRNSNWEKIRGKW